MREPTLELVRIDEHGTAHPVGMVASQRMRQRAGEFRLLPSPGHVVLMRYTGMDGRRDAEDGAVVRIAGEITGPGSVCDVLAMLAQSGPRGEFIVYEGDAIRTLFFDSGNIVGVRTNVEREHIGRVLYQYGIITEQQHEHTMEHVVRGVRYGESVVSLGYATREAVFRCLGRQVAEVFFACMLVADGTYFFLEGFDDDVLASRHTMGAAALLMEGVTRMDEVKYFRARIPSPECVPYRTASGKSPPEELDRVYAAIDGNRSVLEIGRITGKGEFETTKQIYTLAQSKYVEVRPPPAAGGPLAVMETANAILHRLHDAVAEAGYRDALRSALETFTVGAGMHGILFRDAGPDSSGRLDADIVAGNLARIASDAPPIDVLKQLVEEYVGFALFTSEGLLGSDRRQALVAEVSPLLNALRPPA